MANEKIQLNNALKKAESSLYKISNQFEEAEKLNSMIGEIFENILLMEKLTEENPALLSGISKEIKEKKLGSLYKQMEEKLSAAKEKINSFEDKTIRAKLFLENFRTNRVYAFKNIDLMTEFVKQAYPLFSISRISFKPEFIGTVSLDTLAEELEEETKGNQQIVIPTEKLPKLMEIIEKKGLFRNARIENDLLKIVLKGNNEVSVDSDNTRIRRLDRLCRQFDGTCKED
ncbi:MAG: hypothetical protein ABH986_01755 [archaeon]